MATVAATMPAAGGRRRRLRRWALALAATFILSLVWPDRPAMPVQGAVRADWNPRSFWYYPWGASGVHKGIDIFAPEGRPVLPRWHIHYYAHLSRLDVEEGDWVWRGETVGAVGSTGNAAGKPPHLHYAIITAMPYPWRITTEPQGWQKMFFLDPGAEFAD